MPKNVRRVIKTASVTPTAKPGHFFLTNLLENSSAPTVFEGQGI